MRRISLAALFAVPLLLADSGAASAQVVIPSQFPGSESLGGFGGSSTGGYYRQPLYSGSPYGIFSFALKMYPLIHFHGPLVNYGPYEGYYPFQPYGPWTSDLKYAGPPIPKHKHQWQESTAATGWIWGSHSHSHSHGWGHYALATFHNVGLRTHPFKSGCKNCTAAADATSTIVPVANVAVTPIVRER